MLNVLTGRAAGANTSMSNVLVETHVFLYRSRNRFRRFLFFLRLLALLRCTFSIPLFESRFILFLFLNRLIVFFVCIIRRLVPGRFFGRLFFIEFTKRRILLRWLFHNNYNKNTKNKKVEQSCSMVLYGVFYRFVLAR